jgi:hypothetical protein
MDTIYALLLSGAQKKFFIHIIISFLVIIGMFLSCQTINSEKSVAPVIITQPLSQKKTIGESVSFLVEATGTPFPAFQWRKNGQNIFGKTSSTLIIESVKLDDAATYDAVVTNSAGSVISEPAILMVTSGCPYSQNSPTEDPFDPQYRIISPNGGETFHIGQPCTLNVWSRLTGSAKILILIGRYSLTPQEYLGAWGMVFEKDSAINKIIFNIPDSLYDMASDQNVYSVTDSCLIKIENYSNPQYNDYSDCYFRIAP